MFDSITNLTLEGLEDVSVTYELIDTSVAIAYLETENDLPEGNLIIRGSSQVGDFNYTVVARVAVVSNFTFGAFLISSTALFAQNNQINK